MNDIWYDHFMNALFKKYPKKGKLVTALMDLLEIEHESAYRRLRKDVMFPSNEVMKIASEWNISLDEIVGIQSGKVPFMMQPMNYINPSELEMKILQEVVDKLNLLKNSIYSEYMDICNKLPRPLSASFSHLNQFYLFKWRYQYNTDTTPPKPYSQTVISDKQRQLVAEYATAIKEVKHSYFILDRKLFQNLIDDVQYFCSIMMINSKEKNLIKKDLLDLLDYLLKVAMLGGYPETQNKVTIYLSHLNVDTNYSYISTSEAEICFVHVFEKLEVHTFNKEMFEQFKNWMQLRKRTSTQISEVDEKSRIAFFTQQRELINKM
jgi:hypothetical protein